MTSLASASGLNFAKPSNKNKKPPVIDSSSIILGRELGQGEFGSVLMGVWRNENDKSVSSIPPRSLFFSIFSLTLDVLVKHVRTI